MTAKGFDITSLIIIEWINFMLLLQILYNVIELDCYESPHRIFFASFNNDDNAFVQDLALELIICRKRKLSHVPVLRVEVADIATQTYQKNTKRTTMAMLRPGCRKLPKKCLTKDENFYRR